MATIYTPVKHLVHNEIDKHGLLLGLPRLEGEKNAAFKQRLLDVFVHPANSTYQGLINGITRELGLSQYEAITVEATKDSSGETIGTNPVITFEETKCFIYSDFTDLNNGLYATIDRYDRTGNAWNLSQLVTAINNTPYFTAIIPNTNNQYNRSMQIYNQSSLKQVAAEELDTGGPIVTLDNNNLIEGSFAIRSANLFNAVASQVSLVNPGQYYIDYQKGILYSTEAPSSGSIVRYRYKENKITFKASPVILHNLQSADFKTKMFLQRTNEDGTVDNGLPTELGADLINELLSVFGLHYGE